MTTDSSTGALPERARAGTIGLWSATARESTLWVLRDRPFEASRSEMNDSIPILLTIVVASNIVLIAFIVFPSILRQRRDRRFVDSLQPVGTNGTTDEGVDTPTTAQLNRTPAPERTDKLSGLLLPAEWDRIVSDEDTRIRRYGRPATVVLIELDGFDRLVDALGQGAGDRLIAAVADTLSRHARAADQLARLDASRFGVLLPETGEVEAVNYVERIRTACDLWLEAGAVSLRLAIGWAAPATDGSLDDAVAIAEDRLQVELGGSARPATPAPDPAPQVTTDLSGWPTTA